MEIYEDWLSSKMTRSELNELSTEERNERLRLQQKKYDRKYYQENKEENKEKLKESRKKYYEENKEKSKEYYETNKEQITERHKKYRETPTGKKSITLSQWKHYGLQESPEDLDRIYELYLHQELCYSCDIQLTRDGIKCSTQACMDHDHTTNRFRQICCRSCNTQDSWMQYWC